jgi:hypothetical protein
MGKKANTLNTGGLLKADESCTVRIYLIYAKANIPTKEAQACNNTWISCSETIKDRFKGACTPSPERTCEARCLNLRGFAPPYAKKKRTIEPGCLQSFFFCGKESPIAVL